MRTAAYTVAALVAFASNSVLCRMALGQAAIDPVSFSTVRMFSGAATLLLIAAGTEKRTFRMKGSWTSAVTLFLYAIPFSLAYVRLSVGTGALILFGAVQVTMMVAAIRSGEKPNVRQWLGLALALAGLVYLVLPGLTAPSLSGSVFMALAGVSWGIYSLHGRGAANPLAQTAGNFVRTVPLVLVASLIALPALHLERGGVLLAIASGALASGVGYVMWYSALKGLSATRASVVQLIVPVLAGAGGVIFVAETIPARLVFSAAIVLGGIALTLVGRERLPAAVEPQATR